MPDYWKQVFLRGQIILCRLTEITSDVLDVDHKPELYRSEQYTFTAHSVDRPMIAISTECIDNNELKE
jgi:hypothetical protein